MSSIGSVGRRARAAAANSRPPMAGITVSETRRAMSSTASSMARASKPLAASITGKPSSVSCWRITLRTSGSSSTSSTRRLSAARSMVSGGGATGLAAGAAVIGTMKRTLVPLPGVLRMRMLPPDWRMKPYTIDSPRPLPVPKLLVVKKGSKTRDRISGAMPLPLSETSICT